MKMSLNNAEAGPPCRTRLSECKKQLRGTTRSSATGRCRASRRPARAALRKGTPQKDFAPIDVVLRDTSPISRVSPQSGEPVMCRDATSCVSPANAPNRRARRRNSDVRTCYDRISYSALNMSSIGRRRNCANPASATSSRAFGSPMHAPIPAPPCASEVVMQ
jgi:hypothetical protein